MTEFRPGRFQVLPPVVKNIIIINVLVVLVQYVLGKYGIDISRYFALHYWRSPFFRWWQLFTHLFLHGDPYDVEMTFFHILFNMFALWMFGRILENVWGPKRFLIFYIVCGLGAALCHLLVIGYEFNVFEKAFWAYQQNPTLDQYILFLKQHNLDQISGFRELQSFWEADPHCANCAARSASFINQYYIEMINTGTVGASGAVFGVLFAFGYLFPNTELMIIPIPIPVKAKWVVTVYALIELYSGLRNSAGDNIAHFAHLGGMLFAFILLKIWGKNVRNHFY